MKNVIFAACLAVSFSAFAGNSNGCQGNCAGGDTYNNEYRMSGGAGGQGGTGVGVGVGIGQGGDAKSSSTAYGGKSESNSGVYGSGNSAVKNDNTNVGVNKQGQEQSANNKQSQSNTSSNTLNSQGGTSYGGNGAGNSTSVTFEGSTYKEAAQTAYAPTPSGPRTSCRLFVGFGGTSTSGALSGGIPIGNDATCLAGAQIEFMHTVNKVQAGTFKAADYLQAVCQAEGMDKMAACKK